VTKGDSYTLSVTASNTLNPGQGYAAWIDWDGDGIFQNSENVLLKPAANSTSQSITIPSTAVASDVLMRVLSVWDGTPDIDAYYSIGYGYGEIEEYTIRISNPVALPVELIEFVGIPYPQWNVINWTTASEYNSDYYVLESSIDGENWKNVCQKPAAINSTIELHYSFIDYNFNELVYYRLIQYDIDGEYKVYGPISVLKSITGKTITRYVNASGQVINPDITEGVIIEVYSDGTIRRVIR
jgi:hypothetical protein